MLGDKVYVEGNREMKEEKLRDSLSITSSFQAKLRDKKGKVILETKKQGDVEKRFTRRTGKAIQIVWKDGKIVHLHCRDKNCGNEWKLRDDVDLKSKFEVSGSTIKCSKCGREYKSG